MNLVATTWVLFRGLVCLSFAALLAGGGCFTIWRFFQGGAPLSNALYSLLALGLAVWVAWFAVHNSAYGRRMFAVAGDTFRFYMACALMLVLSFFMGYLCVYGFLTDQAPSIGRYARPFWISRIEHPGIFWVSIIFHTLLGVVLLFSTVMTMLYRYRQRGKV
jgi:hypothetical protein